MNRRRPQPVRIAARSLALAFLGVAALGGCGQTGPLFLPDATPPVVQAPAPAPTTGTPTAPEKRDEEKEKPR